MEVIHGKDTVSIDDRTLEERLAGYAGVLLDIGAGDGRYVRMFARTRPSCFAIGLDACRENLRASSRSGAPNALYVIANALAMPPELYDRAAYITINFPWGSLLRGLVEAEGSLLQGLRAVSQPGAMLEVRLNAGALTEAGWSFQHGGAAVRRALVKAGFSVGRLQPVDAQALRACPTTWAKRLAFGRDARALYMRAWAPAMHCKLDLPPPHPSTSHF